MVRTRGGMMRGLNRTSMQILFSAVCCLLAFTLKISAQDSLEGEITKEQDEAASEVAHTADIPNITLDFKEADIRNVLRVISLKSGVNIIPAPDVEGSVTVRLDDVPWNEALDAIVKTYGFGYVKKGSIIIVAPLEKLVEQQKLEADLTQTQSTETRVFHLKYLDAKDVASTLESLKSDRGKITVLETTGQAGWEFGDVDDQSKRDRASQGQISRSKVLLVTDIRPIIDEMEKVVAEIDVMPQQILINAKIIEVNRDKLFDIGFDWGTGTTGAESSAVGLVGANKRLGADGTYENIAQFGAQSLGSEVSPSVFGATAGSVSGTEPYNLGLELIYKKLTGTQFEVILHALEEDVNTNTLSAPRILTLNNQEAAILVGTKYPFLKAEQSTTTSGGVVYNYSLDTYRDIGIQLNVVPQICGDDYINLIIHPAVTSFTQTVDAIDSTGAILASYPIIITREADTQVLMKDGETIVIGGLLKDVQKEGRQGVPFLGKIPLLGWLFQRKTTDTQKIDLLIFITAKIVNPGETTEEEITKLSERLGRNPEEIFK